jgi:hypothetical protein
MEITPERWAAAQDMEFTHHQDTGKEAYFPAAKVIERYLEIDYAKDFADKVIVEVGGGPRGSLLLTNGNFKRGILVEPLIERWDDEIRKTYEDIGVEIIAAAYENIEIDEQVDETWFFNVVQHVIDPTKMLEQAKETSKVIRVFESVGSSTDIAHPHYITNETFTNVLGNFGKTFKGGSESGFHSANCYYGTWYKGTEYEYPELSTAE